MFESNAYAFALVPITALLLAAWSISIPQHDISIVDSFWSPFFVAGAAAYVGTVSMAALRVPRDVA